MKELTRDNLIEINKSLNKFGVDFGVISGGNLDFTIEKAAHCQGVFRKAAIVMHGVAVGHPFLDGNKRTAFEAAGFLLSLHGIDLNVEPDEGERFMLRLVSPEGITITETEIWVRKHSDEHGQET